MNNKDQKLNTIVTEIENVLKKKAMIPSSRCFILETPLSDFPLSPMLLMATTARNGIELMLCKEMLNSAPNLKFMTQSINLLIYSVLLP